MSKLNSVAMPRVIFEAAVQGGREIIYQAKTSLAKKISSVKESHSKLNSHACKESIYSESGMYRKGQVGIQKVNATALTKSGEVNTKQVSDAAALNKRSADDIAKWGSGSTMLIDLSEALVNEKTKSALAILKNKSGSVREALQTLKSQISSDHASHQDNIEKVVGSHNIQLIDLKYAQQILKSKTASINTSQEHAIKKWESLFKTQLLDLSNAQKNENEKKPAQNELPISVNKSDSNGLNGLSESQNNDKAVSSGQNGWSTFGIPKWESSDSIGWRESQKSVKARLTDAEKWEARYNNHRKKPDDLLKPVDLPTVPTVPTVPTENNTTTSRNYTDNKFEGLDKDKLKSTVLLKTDKNVTKSLKSKVVDQTSQGINVDEYYEVFAKINHQSMSRFEMFEK